MTNQPHRIEQAVFTSARTARGQGYQLVARSAGISRRHARELARWRPTHNSLLDASAERRSINSHRLTCGAFCVSLTTPAGTEYSRRTGPRIATHCLVICPETYRRFANNPFAVAAAHMPSHVLLDDQTGPHLEPLFAREVDGHVDLAAAMKLRGQGRWQHLVTLLDALLAGPLVGVTGYDDYELLFAAVVGSLPISLRAGISLSTGLIFSQQRPYQLSALPSDPLIRRRLRRQTGMIVVDFSRKLPAALSPRHDWTAFVMAVGEAEAWHKLRHAVTDPDGHAAGLSPRPSPPPRSCSS